MVPPAFPFPSLRPASPDDLGTPSHSFPGDCRWGWAEPGRGQRRECTKLLPERLLHGVPDVSVSFYFFEQRLSAGW